MMFHCILRVGSAQGGEDAFCQFICSVIVANVDGCRQKRYLFLRMWRRKIDLVNIPGMGFGSQNVPRQGPKPKGKNAIK